MPVRVVKKKLTVTAYPACRKGIHISAEYLNVGFSIIN